MNLHIFGCIHALPGPAQTPILQSFTYHRAVQLLSQCLVLLRSSSERPTALRPPTSMPRTVEFKAIEPKDLVQEDYLILFVLS